MKKVKSFAYYKSEDFGNSYYVGETIYHYDLLLKRNIVIGAVGEIKCVFDSPTTCFFSVYTKEGELYNQVKCDNFSVTYFLNKEVKNETETIS